MKASSVRIKSITLQNFKNVVYGNLSLENPRKKHKASIVGIYGQNGSGKSALIEAIDLLSYVLRGRQIPGSFADSINVDAKEAVLSFEFSIQMPEGLQTVTYQFSMSSTDDYSDQNSEVSLKQTRKITIYNELIKCPILSDKRTKIGRLIDTNCSEAFSPVSKRLLLTGKDKDAITDLLVAKKLAAASSRSFIFSRELLTIIRENDKKLYEEACLSKELDFYHCIIESLVEYGNDMLFVVRTSNTGLISLNAQPLLFKYRDSQTGYQGTIMIPLNAPIEVDQRYKTVAEKIIENTNIVLKQLIPGLTIGVRDLGTVVLQDGKSGSRIQLVSYKNDKEIPLQYESEGIKKIISILQLLVVVYNQPSITVAVDELDAGVFEYLLGELLRIIAEKGKGQLIFTSHNLRPLETLDRGFIVFTTTNPNNRYVRMTNVKDNNNLRDFYYRDIMLGEQDEELYETTNNAEIALAFREAGEHSGS